MELKSKNYKLHDYFLLVFRTAPLWTVIYIADTILVSLFPMLKVIYVARFLDGVNAFFDQRNGWKMLYDSFWLLFILSLEYINDVLIRMVKIKLENCISLSVNSLFLKRRAVLKYRYIEDNDSWVLIGRVCDNAAKQILDGFYNLIWAGRLLGEIFSVSFVIFMQIKGIVFVLIFVIVPLFVLAIKLGRYNYNAYKEAKKHEQIRDYYKEIIVGREAVNERILFGFASWVERKWDKKYEESRNAREKAERYNFVRMKGASLLTIFISVFVSGNLIYALKSSNITVGYVIALIKEIFSLIHTMSWDLSDIIEELVRQQSYLKDLSTFSKLEIQRDIVDCIDESKKIDIKSIELKDVTFSYPNCKSKVLNKLSFKLDCNKTYALVGENGSGKTTIIKLLLGMYDTYEGTILVNNKDIREIDNNVLK